MVVSRCLKADCCKIFRRCLLTSSTRKGIREFREIPEVSDITDDGIDISLIYERWKRCHNKYGNIFRIKTETQDEVYCNSREDTETIFRIRDRHPFRIKNEGATIVKDILQLPDDVANLRGEDWYRLRKPLNELMLKNRMVWKYTSAMHEVAKDFVQYIDRHKNCCGEVPDLDIALNKCSFEMAGTFSFNTRLGLLQDDESSSVNDAFEGVQHMMAVGAAGMHGSSSWNDTEKEKLELNTKRMGQVLDRILDEQRTRPNFSDTLLGGILSRDDLSEMQKVSLVYDLMLSSLETPSGLAIYCLTLDPGVQERLRQESMSLFSNGCEQPSGRNVDGMRYMNAFFKEAHRLYPFSHSMVREFSEDVVLSGYRVPAGVRIISTINSTQNRNPEYFSNPDAFLPERWLEKDGSTHRFTSTGTFGVGPRACPGRRLAMQGMYLLLIEILKNFKVEYHYKPMVSIYHLIGAPSEKCRFTFRRL